MNTFNGFEWLLIDLASRYGHDNITFEKRIAWSEELLNLFKVETLQELKSNLNPWMDEADDPEMFSGCALAIWDAYHKRESTWQVGQDAASSGPALLSTLLKCTQGMQNTGIIGEDVPDLYQSIKDVLGSEHSRTKVKKATVPHVYASLRAPKNVFGDNYPDFVQAYTETVPMAELAKNILVEAWDSNATFHEWVLPDGATAHIKVLNTVKKANYPLGKHSYTYQYQAIGCKQLGDQGTKSLSANTTHSYDAYILRELNRRCNYDQSQLETALHWLSYPIDSGTSPELSKLQSLYEEFNQTSLVCVEYISPTTVGVLSSTHKRELRKLILECLNHPSFEVTNIHDEFKCLPNYVSRMREVYRQLMTETYVSNWWYSIAEKLTGTDLSWLKVKPELKVINEIKQSLYAIN